MTSIKITFWNRDRITGLIVYPLGDFLAQLISGRVSILRIVIMAFAGGFIYAWEIPKWFGWIRNNIQNPFARAFAAVIYFNPLWIMRHILLVVMATEFNRLLVWSNYPEMFNTALNSFLGAILVSVFCNYAIQNWISTERRFMASSVFSGFMAMYYALSKVWLEKL